MIFTETIVETEADILPINVMYHSGAGSGVIVLSKQYAILNITLCVIVGRFR